MYDIEASIYNIGVIACLLLTGDLPQNIEEFSFLDSSQKAVIESMLEEDGFLRAQAEDVLNMPWFQLNQQGSFSVHQEMQEWNQVLRLLATLCSLTELQSFLLSKHWPFPHSFAVTADPFRHFHSERLREFLVMHDPTKLSPDADTER